MADYAAAASQIYDPQLQADKAQLDSGLAQTNQALDTENKTVESDYTNSLTDTGKQYKNDEDQAGFTASTHGLFGSGLAGNQSKMIYQDYQDNTGRLAQARADKLADITGRRTLAQQGYSGELGALGSKYQALKNEYVSEQQQHDADVARQNAILQAQQTASRSSYSSGGGGSSSGSKSSAAAAAPSNYSADAIFGLIHDIRNSPSSYHASWGQIASILGSKGIDTSHNSAADVALRRYFGQS